MARFHIQLTAFKGQLGRQAELIRQQAAVSLFSRVILATPVDTGRLRGNWQAGIRDVPGGDMGSPALGQVIARMRGVIDSARGDAIILANNLPYALPIEYGGSKQAPAGMVRVNVAAWQAVVAAAARGVH